MLRSSLAAIAAITVTLSASSSFAQSARPNVFFEAEEEPVSFHLETPAGAPSPPCTTPCALSLPPMDYTIHGDPPTIARRSDYIGPGQHRFVFRSPRVSAGGVVLTVLGSASLVLGAIFLPFAAASSGLTQALWLIIGIPSAVAGTLEIIPGIVLLARGPTRAIDRIPVEQSVSFAPFVPSMRVSF